MPVEVKELIIRAKIFNGVASSTGSQQEISAEDKEEIIAACVDQVLKILEHSQER